MYFELRGIKYTGTSLEEASRIYVSLREASNEGASTWPNASIFEDTGKFIGRLSYNAKIWSEDNALLYNPY